MKKVGVFIIFVILFNLNLVLAETTFFEGELGYRDDFIMDDLTEEVVEPVLAEIEIGTLETGGGGFIIGDDILACPLISESLREHIVEKQNIDYTEQELIILTEEINQELNRDLTNSQVSYIIENFEETCERPFPLFGGIATGRLRELLQPFLIFITIIILVFIILIGYLIIRTLRRRGYGKRRRRKKK